MSVPNSPKLVHGQSRSVPRPPLQSQNNVLGSPLPSPYLVRNRDSTFYRSTSLETRSRSPSPTLSPTSTPQQEYYGTANLTDRSRSPSPVASPPKRQPRKLPEVPVPKPSTLNLAQPKLKEAMPRVMPSPTIPQPPRSPGNMNFPRLNMSPSHVVKSHGRQTHQIPPAKFGKPEPYSPTEKNSVNQPSGSSHSRTLPSSHRSDPHDKWKGYDWNWDNSRSPVMGRRSQSDRSRLIDHQFGEPPGGKLAHASGSRRAVSTLPNGFKPKGRNKTEKLELRSDSNAPLKNNSDEEEDSDWC